MVCSDKMAGVSLLWSVAYLVALCLASHLHCSWKMQPLFHLSNSGERVFLLVASFLYLCFGNTHGRRQGENGRARLSNTCPPRLSPCLYRARLLEMPSSKVGSLRRRGDNWSPFPAVLTFSMTFDVGFKKQEWREFRCHKMELCSVVWNFVEVTLCRNSRKSTASSRAYHLRQMAWEAHFYCGYKHLLSSYFGLVPRMKRGNPRFFVLHIR